MTTFTVTITDPSFLAGITAARAEYNSTIPETTEDPDNPGSEIPNPARINTDAAYVQFVMSRAAESYSKQYNI